MNKFFETLIDLLKQDDRLISKDGDLLKNKVQELSYKLDGGLIGLLLDDNKTRERFFVKIKDVLVFDSNKFIKLINNKEFLPDSYTSFKNKIGLVNSKNEFISDTNDVSLVRPYKDCILAGGQDKEDEKRDEIFYNEILGAEDIDRLLDDKVFTRFKRIDKDGEKDLKSFNKDENGDIKDNLIIKGNNLLALHSFKKKFKGRVKLIYIDPPYYFKDNKPEDSFQYNSNFKLSTWLTFMKNRLDVAKDLLSDDGVIFVQIKDDGMAHLKLLMDSVFGDNFVNCIAVKMSEASGVKMSHAIKRFPNIKEYILFYKKSNNFNGFYKIDKYESKEWDKENNIFLDNFTKEQRGKLIEIEEKEEILKSDIESVIKILSKVKKIALGQKLKELSEGIDQNDWLFENSYRIIKTAGSSGLAKQVIEFKEIPKQDISAFTSRNGILFYYITDFNRDTASPRLQVIFADQGIWKNPCDFWQDIKTTGAIAKERGVQLSGGKKPEKLLQRIIDMTTQEGDIVLDYHSGSGTTAGVAHKMKRQWITIEQIDTQIELTKTGLKNVITGDETGISKEVDWAGGGDFIYMEILQQNENIISKIEESTDIEKLIKIYVEIKKSGFVNYNVDYKNIDENISEFKELDLDKQKEFLMELLDKNALYVNYSEMNDSDNEISKEDKDLNDNFYN